jgi:hypothetical protein
MQLKHNTKQYFVYFQIYILWISTRPTLNLGNTSELATNMKNPIGTSYHTHNPKHRGIASILVYTLQFQTITSTFRPLPDQTRKRGCNTHG